MWLFLQLMKKGGKKMEMWMKMSKAIQMFLFMSEDDTLKEDEQDAFKMAALALAYVRDMPDSMMDYDDELGEFVIKPIPASSDENPGDVPF